MSQLARQSKGLDPTATAWGEAHLTTAIVVCTRNRPGCLRNCLQGIAKLKRVPDEVIVIDNTAGDKETEAVADEFGATYMVEPHRGLSRARNRGLADSHSEIVAYLDDDATPDENWLEMIAEPFKDPKVTTVTGRIITPRSKPRSNETLKPRSLSNKDPEWFGIATFGGLGLGSNMAFRREACVGQKIFDERLGRGAPFEIAEENYAFAFLLSQGHTAVFLPDAIVYHPDGNASDIRQDARNSIAFSMLLFSEFPSRRLDLVRFLYRRLRRKPLSWPRDSPDPGEIITSGWRTLVKASFEAALLFIRARKTRDSG